MSSRSNLSPTGFDRRYYKVTAPFDVYLLTYTAESNTHVGSSMAYSNVYMRTLALPGDEVHHLPGGTFLVRDGHSSFALVALNPKHLFEHGPGPAQQWPLDRLAEIADPTKPDTYRPTLNTISRDYLAEIGAVPFERSIDYVYDSPSITEAAR